MMTSILNEGIDQCLREAEGYDKKVAQHLKEIISETTHLDEKVFNEIIDALINEMEKENNFKVSFKKVCERYCLKGDVIRARLPRILTRIILNESKFLKEIARIFSVAPDVEESLESIIQPEDLINAVNSRNLEEIEKTFQNLKLHSRREVVFATFDEDNPGSDPFKFAETGDIINRLALDRSVFQEGEPVTGVSIRYRNKKDVKKRFPVFTDAEWYDKFYPSDENDRYGRTKPLDISSTGMPEIVHKNLKIADIIEEIQFLEE